jgi:hypothetical protein
LSSHQPHTQPIGIQANTENDEIRALKDELKNYHQENDELRRLLRESNGTGKKVNSSTTDQYSEVTTITTLSPDSIPDTPMPISTYTIHFEQRERKLQDEIHSLTEVRREKMLSKRFMFTI